MRIAVAADERVGVTDAVVEELRGRGHETVLHGALAEDEREDRAWCAAAIGHLWHLAEIERHDA